MSEPNRFNRLAESTSGIGANLALLEQVAASVHRVQGDESFDAEGIRSISHRGHQHTEMLSWEREDGTIVRQALAFFGMVVELEQGTTVRTGSIPLEESLTNAGANSDLVQIHPEPSATVLDYASHLLKHVRARDYYAQHLLKHINQALTTGGFDEGRTAVSKVEAFSRQNTRQATMTHVSIPATAPRRLRGALIVLALAAVGIGLGSLLGALLLK